MAVSRPLVPLVRLLPADSGQHIRREHGEHGLGRKRVVVSGFGQTGTTSRHTTACHAAWVLSCVVRARGWYAYMTLLLIWHGCCLPWRTRDCCNLALHTAQCLSGYRIIANVAMIQGSIRHHCQSFPYLMRIH
jgi:hypothetical protein